ncbi:hypothetical protein [Scytonema hofmannii]|nr:hypothetical protein [Scytonema hofmannii]
MQAVVGDLIEAGYEGFKIVANESYINRETQEIFDIKMIQEIVKVKSIS